MQVLRNVENPNTVIGVLMLVLLVVFAGPSTIYGLISRAAPGVTIDTPCDWMRNSPDRARHQSWLGRSATSPITVEVATTAMPITQDGVLTVTIIVVNRTMGTVAFLFNPTQVRIGDDGTSGLGIVFDNNTALNSPTLRQDTGTYPTADVRTLGPRQRCVVRLDFTWAQLTQAGFGGNSNVRAFYRIASAGVVLDANAIFPDQGFRPFFITSEPVFIPVASQ
ncbi:MAG: hypothetical protein U0694_13950 [Anaerolineae bacterium]